MKKQDSAPRKLQLPRLSTGKTVSIAVALLVLALLVGFGIYLNAPRADEVPTSASQMVFAVARVNDVLMDNAEPDDYPRLNAETGTIYFTGVTGGDVYILTAYFTDTRTPGLTITKTASVNGDVINSDETVDVGDVITWTC